MPPVKQELPKGPLEVEIDMKFATKSLVAAAALAAMGLANAAPITAGVGQKITVTDPGGSGRQAELSLLSGSGALAFSPGSSFDGVNPDTIGGLIGALNVGKVTISGVGGATYSETSIEDEFGDTYRTGATANASVISLTADNVTGKVLAVGSQGGAKQVGTRIGGTLNGGEASVTNLRFDLDNKVVYADLIGRSAAVGTTKPAVDYVSLNTALWTIGAISGPTTIPPSALLAADPKTAMVAAGFTFVSKVGDLYTFSATNEITGLKVTQAGFDFFKNSLGLLPTGISALEKVNDDVMGWGKVSSSMTFTVREVQTIPEPSTYALMGLGLVGIGMAARRRAAK